MGKHVTLLTVGILSALCMVGCNSSQQSSDEATDIAAEAKQRNTQLQEQQQKRPSR